MRHNGNDVILSSARCNTFSFKRTRGSKELAASLQNTLGADDNKKSIAYAIIYLQPSLDYRL